MVRKDCGLTEKMMPDNEVLELFAHVDVDGSGSIELREFEEILSGSEGHRSSSSSSGGSPAADGQSLAPQSTPQEPLSLRPWGFDSEINSLSPS